MKRAKRITALILALVLVFAASAAAIEFTDGASIQEKYKEDVAALVERGIISGYPDGSFGPAKNITRAEFAKMAFVLVEGKDADASAYAAKDCAFTDVKNNAGVSWAKGYINYCYEKGIVSGVGNNNFNPQGNIKISEAVKMILVIMGCDAEKNGFTGANWAANVTAKAIDLGVFNGWSGNPSKVATREEVAKLMNNAVKSSTFAN